MRRNYCTLYPDGDWSLCCYDHDAMCLLAEELKSKQVRLQGDKELYNCVKEKGHPIHAAIMYCGVRAWAILNGGY